MKSPSEVWVVVSKEEVKLLILALEVDISASLNTLDPTCTKEELISDDSSLLEKLTSAELVDSVV